MGKIITKEDRKKAIRDWKETQPEWAQYIWSIPSMEARAAMKKTGQENDNNL